MSIAAAVHEKAIKLGKLALRMTAKSGSGHPSSALSLAHLVTYLMYHQMKYDPADPWNLAGDRLVLSEGHAVPIVYAAWADLGGIVGDRRGGTRKLTIDDLETLRVRDRRAGRPSESRRKVFHFLMPPRGVWGKD